MKIRYLGHSCFFLADSAGTSVVTDPYDGVGFPLPAVLASAISASHKHFDHYNIKAVKGNPAVFDRAGSSRLNGVDVSAIPSFHDEVKGAKRGGNLIFKFSMDGLNVCHLGDIGEPCNPSLVESIAPVDILLIPVGGNYTIDAVRAKEYIDAIKPAVVIPMHYKVAGLQIDIAPLDGFLALFAGENIERAGSCEIELSREKLTHAGTKIIVLERE